MMVVIIMAVVAVVMGVVLRPAASLGRSRNHSSAHTSALGHSDRKFGKSRDGVHPFEPLVLVFLRSTTQTADKHGAASQGQCNAFIHFSCTIKE